MKRELRYIVIKIKDAEACLNAAELLALEAICKEVGYYRDSAGKRPLECVVVESDWPEYEPTWAAIASRMDAMPNAESEALT